MEQIEQEHEIESKKSNKIDQSPSSPKMKSKNGGTLRRQGSASKTRRSRIPIYRPRSASKRVPSQKLHKLIALLQKAAVRELPELINRMKHIPNLDNSDRISLMDRQSSLVNPRAAPIVLNRNNLDATLNLKHQFSQKLKQEREKCAELETENRNLIATIRKMEAELNKKLLPGGVDNVQTNQANYWRNKVREASMQHDQTEKLLHNAVKDAEMEAEVICL